MLNINLGEAQVIPYSRKFLHGANFRIFRMHVLHAKIKITNISTIENFVWTLTSLHAVKIAYGQLELCQIFEQSTQRLLISRTIKTEAKKAHKPIILWAFWPDIRKFAPTKISRYTVLFSCRVFKRSTVIHKRMLEHIHVIQQWKCWGSSQKGGA